VTKTHNPTPAERDEKFSLYGMDPEAVGEAVLNAKPKPEPTKDENRRRSRRATTARNDE
jgi:hypothetical protein